MYYDMCEGFIRLKRTEQNKEQIDGLMQKRSNSIPDTEVTSLLH